MSINSKKKGASGERDNKGRFKPKDNIYIIKNDIVECYTQEKDLLFYTDASNIDTIRKYNWCKYANGYVTGNKNGESVVLHRYLTKCTDKTKVIDHINQNKFDNRLENLRICDKSTNAFNTKMNNNNTSGIKGVWYRNDTKKWVAEIKYHYKKINLGCYSNKDEAVLARKKAEDKINSGQGDELFGNK